jgi:transcriptional regulator with XRE-family HTH domain
VSVIQADPRVVGANIRLLRGYRAMSREHLAESVGVVGTTVRRFEVGERLPRARLLTLIARVLGVPTSALTAPIQLSCLSSQDRGAE